MIDPGKCWRTMLVVLVSGLCACGDNGSGQGGGKDADTANNLPLTARVTVFDQTAFPAVVVIGVGGTVTWENRSLDKHHMVNGNPGEDDVGTLFDSNVILESPGFVPSREFSVTFDGAAEVPYFCVDHPMLIHGVIKVQ